MKEIQTIISVYMLNRNKQKKYLAVFLVLAILVSMAVSLGLMQPASSMTKETSQFADYNNNISLLSDTTDQHMVSNLNNGQNANDGYSKGQLSEKALLIGDDVDWAKGLTSAEDVISAAKREYFLGIASDFCVFLKDDFTPKAADTEGRVAVGGNIKFEASGDYNYQVASGDYDSMTALMNTDNYLGISNFAHAIVGGYIKNIATLSAVGNDAGFSKREDMNELAHNQDSTTVYYPANEDLYKRFVVGTNDTNNSLHYTYKPSKDWLKEHLNYSTSCEHDSFTQLNELAQIYQANNLINFTEVFTWIESQSTKLSQKNAVSGTISEDNVTVTFDGSSYPEGTETYYFSLSAWNSSIRTVKFTNVGDNANLIVNCGDIDVNLYERNGEDAYFSTYINGTCISKFNESAQENKKTDNTNVGNNSKQSEQILYNFYQATSVNLAAHVNGTILAPKADVTSKNAEGKDAATAHLSGALIAQSYEGGMEFGYRPYRGGTDILGSTAGYTIPVDKLVNSDANNTTGDHLKGASMIIKDKETNQTVASWTSGDGTEYENSQIPSAVDFSGDTNYLDETTYTFTDDGVYTITKEYTVSEQSPPTGYIGTNTTYTVTVTEKIYKDYLMRAESIQGTIPQKVDVIVQITKDETGAPTQTLNFTIKDAYNENGQVQRRIYVQNDDGSQTIYAMDIESQEVKQVGKVSDDVGGEEEATYTTTTTTTTVETIIVSSSELDVPDLSEGGWLITVDGVANAIKLSFSGGAGVYVNGGIKNPNTWDTVGNWEGTFDSDGNLTVQVLLTEGLTDVAVQKWWPEETAVTLTKAVLIYSQPVPDSSDSDNSDADTPPATEEQPTAYTIGKLAWNGDLTIPTGGVTNLTFYYKEGEPRTIDNVKWSGDSSSWQQIDLQDIVKENVVGISITVNSGSGNLVIQDGVNWGSIFDTGESGRNIDATNGEVTVNFGSIPQSSTDDTNTESSNENVDDSSAELNPNTDSGITPMVADVENIEGESSETESGDTSGGTDDPQTEPPYTYIKVNKVTIINTINTESNPITNDSDKLYYNPDSLMLMPLPSSNLKFVNTYGLVFNKVDDQGNPLTGATIVLESGTINDEGTPVEFTEVSNEPSWSWGANSSSATIDIRDLTEGTVYRFREASSPTGYEKAEPIYFEKTDDTTIRYTQDSTLLGNQESWDKITMTSDSTNVQKITMIDFGIYGAKVSLEKTDNPDSGNAKRLSGAKFKLYAVTGTEENDKIPVYPIGEGTDVITVDKIQSLYDFFKGLDTSEYNNDYVKNGYLLEGTYWLEETKAPDGYEAADGGFYFSVTANESDNSYTVGVEDGPPTEEVYEISNPIGELCVGKTFTSNQIITKIEVEMTVNSNDSHAIQIKPDNNGSKYMTFNLVNGTNTFTKENGQWNKASINNDNDPTFTKSSDLYINTDGKIGITYWGGTISKIRFYTSPIIPDDYTITGINLTNPDPYYSSTNITVDGQDKTLDVGQTFSSNQKISRIEIDVSNAQSWAAIQIKPDGQFLGNNYNVSLNNGTNIIDVTTQFSGKDIYLNTSGQIGYNAWDCSISEIRIYIEVVEASKEKPALSISALKVYYLEKAPTDITLEPSLEAGDTPDENGAYSFNINSITDKNGIVGMDVTLTGTGTGNINIIGNNGTEGATNSTIWSIKNATGSTTPYPVGKDYTPSESSSSNKDLVTVTPSQNTNENEITISIKNDEQGDKTTFKVKKSWLKDTNFKDLRTEVKFELYQAETEQDAKDKKGEKVTYNNQTEFTLNAANKWEYEFKNLDSKIGDTNNRYYYYVKETSTHNKYTTSYSDPVTNSDITITNTLETVNIPVKKVWSIPEEVAKNSVTKPEIQVKLQWKATNADDTAWVDVSGLEPITLNSDNATSEENANEWSATFTNLPQGYDYKVVEVNVPSGWTDGTPENENIVTSVGETCEKTLTITNTLDTGSLNIEKEWKDNNNAANKRPENIKINLYRSTTPPVSNVTENGVVIPSNSKYAGEVTEDYARLLQYSLYFYDAQMCGSSGGDTRVLSWRDDCHTYDGDYSGGFHDAGDYVMFGLPQGYSASTLGWSLYEYRDTYDTLGITNHMQVILNHFNDFFKKSYKTDDDGNITEILVQKGNGNTDHDYWGHAEDETLEQRGGLVWSTTQSGVVEVDLSVEPYNFYIEGVDNSSIDETTKAQIIKDVKENADIQVQIWSATEDTVLTSAYITVDNPNTDTGTGDSTDTSGDTGTGDTSGDTGSDTGNTSNTPTAVTPDLPNDAKIVATYTLKSSESWKTTINPLPKTDGNGNTYYYYIAEMYNGQIATAIHVNGGKYIPTAYSGNGSSLSGTPTLKVTNTLDESEETLMPSTGGTGIAGYKLIGMLIITLTGTTYVIRRRLIRRR